MFTPEGENRLFSVPDAGGEATPLTTLAAGEATHRFPHFLSDGKRFIYLAQSPGGTPSQAYVTALDAPDERERLFDSASERLEAITPPGAYESAVLSPKGRSVAFTRREPPLTGDRELWIVDVERGTHTRFATGLGTDVSGAWSPDGTGLVFVANRAIQRKQLGRADEPETLMAAQPAGDPSVPSWPGRLSVAPDGSFVIFESWDSVGDWDLWILPLDGESVPRPLVKADRQQLAGQVSPDARFLAYESDESGVREIFVQRLDATGAKWIVSTGGGSLPHWSPGGDELFYVAPDGWLMAVEIRTAGELEFGAPVALFKAPAGLAGGYTDLSVVPQLVSGDGRRFLFVVPTGGQGAPVMNVVVNWEEAF